MKIRVKTGNSSSVRGTGPLNTSRTQVLDDEFSDYAGQSVKNQSLIASEAGKEAKEAPLVIKIE